MRTRLMRRVFMTAAAAAQRPRRRSPLLSALIGTPSPTTTYRLLPGART